MPKRFCQCRGCPACNTQAGRHGALFDADTTRTLKCPPCQGIATQRRNARPNTTSRGYGSEHQTLRRQLLEQFQPGQLCRRCNQAIESKDDADLGHADGQQGYRGLEHSWCNRGAPSRARRGQPRP